MSRHRAIKPAYVWGSDADEYAADKAADAYQRDIERNYP